MSGSQNVCVSTHTHTQNALYRAKSRNFSLAKTRLRNDTWDTNGRTIHPRKKQIHSDKALLVSGKVDKDSIFQVYFDSLQVLL